MSSQAIEKISIDDELLTWGVEQRKDFIRKMMKADGSLPDDPKERALVLKALDGIDKTAVSRKRLKIEDKAATSNAETAKLIAEFYGRVQVSNPFVIDQNMQEVPPRPAPQIPANMPDIEVVDGEMETTPPQDDYAGFMKRMNGGEG